MTDTKDPDQLRSALRMLAPGTVLREGIERVIRAGRGALIVIGWTGDVDAVVSGGFAIETNTTAQRLAELAKMDGAIILDGDGGRILRANVHLVPDPTIPTQETGTRHRTAQRVARQTNTPVVSVSESMSMVTLYVGERKRALEDVSVLLFRANQALSTLERYRSRLDEVSSTLTAREIEDTVTLRDVATTVQRLEMVRRIAREVDDYVDELGTEGRLVDLQLEELMASVDDERELIVRDYTADRRRKLASQLAELDGLGTDDLLAFDRIAEVLGYQEGEGELPVTPRGWRLLSKIPRLPSAVVERLVSWFGDLQSVLDASLDDLDEVEGIGDARARTIQDGLRRMAESSLLERYV